MVRSSVIVAFVGCLLVSLPAAGDELPIRERISRLKNATVLVRQSNEFRGTACCIHPDGWFITATSSLAQTKDSDIQLILDVAGENERSAPARVARTDTATGLTLLRADGGDFVSLPLGMDRDLFETNVVNVIGYPLQSGVVRSADVPEIEVHTTRIKSLKRVDGKLNSFGLERRLPRGAAGGPVVDAQGALIGILAYSPPRADIESAVVVSRIRESLLSPLIECPLQNIPSTDLARVCEIPVRVVMFRAANDLEVTLELTSGSQSVSVTAEPGADSQFLARTVLPAEEVMPRLQIEAQFGNDSRVGFWEGPIITIGEELVPICELRRFEFSPQSKEVTIMTNERTVTGPVQEFPMARLESGGVVSQVDLLQADRVFGTLVPAEKSGIDYRIVVRDAGTPVGELHGQFQVDTIEAITVERDPRPRIDFPSPQLSEAQTIIRLPAPIDDVVAGAGGRFLLLHLSKIKQLAVFDVSQMRVVKYIPLPSSNITYAAGAAKLFIGRQDDRRLQRWDLQALEPELTVDAPPGGVRKLAMGAKSWEPLFLLSERDAKKSWLIDTVSLKAEPIQWEGWRGGAWGPVHINVSHNGDSVIVCGGGWAGMELARISEGRLQSRTTGGRSLDEALIAGNGALVFPTKQSVVRDDLTSVVSELEGIHFPALDDLLSVSYVRRDNIAVLHVFTNTDARRICTIRELPELNAASALPIHKRVLLIPNANVLVTIGDGNDQLIVRPFDLEKLLESDDLDYLFVRSEPQRTVTRGDQFSYPIRVMSRRGDVNFSLESGPPAMTVSSEGLLSWKVPVSIEPGDLSIIIKISDKSQQEVFHNFHLRVK